MAKNSLDQELDKLYQFLFPPGASAGSDSLLREEMDKEVHILSIHKKTIINQLKMHKERVGARGVKGAARKKYPQTSPFGNIDEDKLASFAADLINGMHAAVKGGTYGGAKVNIGAYTRGVILKITVSDSASPYDTLSDLRTNIGKPLMEGQKHKAIFKGTEQSIGQLVNIGHRVGVVHGKMSAFSSELEDHKGKMIIGDIDVAQDAIDTVREYSLKYGINLMHYKDLKIKDGKIAKRIQVESDIEGGYYNDAVKANKAEGTGLSEQDIGKLIQKVIEETRKKIESHFDNLGAEELSKLESSQSMINDMKGMILFSSGGLARIIKRGKSVRRKLPKIKKPKKSKVRSKTKTREHKLKAKRDNNYSPVPARKVRGRSGAKEAPNSLASLYSLLNAKLPRTVAQNMGSPGLENRTGAFASSVRVTDVNQTAQGYPSVGYTYQKNPYQIFEMGSGKAPWATTGRDPRTLIDASIREVARELAVGRFYTRRV